MAEFGDGITGECQLPSTDVSGFSSDKTRSNWLRSGVAQLWFSCPSGVDARAPLLLRAVPEIILRGRRWQTFFDSPPLRRNHIASVPTPQNIILSEIPPPTGQICNFNMFWEVPAPPNPQDRFCSICAPITRGTNFRGPPRGQNTVCCRSRIISGTPLSVVDLLWLYIDGLYSTPWNAQCRS